MSHPTWARLVLLAQLLVVGAPGQCASVPMLCAPLQPCACSFVFVDWSRLVPTDLVVDRYVLDYRPAVGSPSPGSTVAGNTLQLVINGTTPATEYSVLLTAYTDDSSLVVLDKPFHSSPEPPLVLAVTEFVDGVTIRLQPQQTPGITYYAEYHPVGDERAVRTAEADQPQLHIQQLQSGTNYRFRLFSMYHGQVSATANRIVIRTKSFDTDAAPVENEPVIRNDVEQQRVATSTQWTKIELEPDDTSSTLSTKATDYNTQVVTPVQFAVSGDRLVITWDNFDLVECDVYKVFYKAENERRAVSKQMVRQSLVIKLLTASPIHVEVLCLSGDAVDPRWKAKGVYSSGRPAQVQRLHVVDYSVDHQNIVDVRLGIRWPVHHAFDAYDLVVTYYGNEDTDVRQKNMSSRDDTLIQMLTPAETYTFTVRNMSRLGAFSENASISFTTPPLITSDIITHVVTTDTANLTFTETVVGRFDYYEFIFIDAVTGKNRTKDYVPHRDRRVLFLDGLAPGRTYRAALYTVYQGMRSRPVLATVTTYPLEVTRTVCIVGDTWATLHWAVANHSIYDKKFRIGYHGSNNAQTQSIYVNGRNFYRFARLEAASWYTFTVSVVMDDLESVAVSVNIVTNPEDMSVPEVKQHSNNQLSVRFTKHIFPNLNGKVTNYAVIVCPIQTVNDVVPYPLPTWAQQYNKPGSQRTAYQTSPVDYNPFAKGGSAYTSFYVGASLCKADQPMHYCNGPIRQRNKYRIKIRGCTNNGVCMETSYVRVKGEKQNVGRGKNGYPDEDEYDYEFEETSTQSVNYLNKLWFKNPFASAACRAHHISWLPLIPPLIMALPIYSFTPL